MFERKQNGRVWLGLAIVLMLGMAAFAGMAYYVIPALGFGSSLNVESDPSGASVLINGHVAGATPITIRGLAQGTYSIRLEKAEFAPLSTSVLVTSTNSAHLQEKLQPVENGTLIVNIKPADSEVLVDGEMVGHTPLTLNGVETGSHELLVRKTNFSTYTQRILITSGLTSKFEDIELTDKILELMENKVKAEPQRVANYIDLAHYYFILDRMDDSVDMFVRGNDVLQTPLDFDGVGFPGKDKMSAEEIENEQRLRREDASRYPKELDKHRSFANKDVKLFRMKLAEAFDNSTRRDNKSWPRTKSAAEESIKNYSYDQALQIYKDFIAAAPLSPDLSKAYIALISVHCMKGDVDGAAQEFNRFYALYEKKDGVALRSCGNVIDQYYDRPKDHANQDRLLKIAEKALRAGLEFPCDNDARSQTLFDLGISLYNQERVSESVPMLRQSIVLTRAPSLQEDRQLRLAEALRKSGDRNAAMELYDKLKNSERPNVRESANYGIIALKQSDSKQ